MTDILDDYLIHLAAVDNEKERTGKKAQEEWENEMSNPDKFAEWQAQHTIKHGQQAIKLPGKTITLKNTDKKPDA